MVVNILIPGPLQLCATQTIFSYSQILHMEPRNFCQSCTMPIDNIADRGTEIDGSKSNTYCKYCYQDGHFVNPEMTFEEMKDVVATQMRKMNIPEPVVQQSLNMLPHLKRWQRAVPEHV